MIRKDDLKKGDLVQINPDIATNPAFAGCIMVVTEPKGWGAMGYVQSLGESRMKIGGLAYYRALWDEMELVGHAVWVAEPGVARETEDAD